MEGGCYEEVSGAAFIKVVQLLLPQLSLPLGFQSGPSTRRCVVKHVAGIRSGEWRRSTFCEGRRL